MFTKIKIIRFVQVLIIFMGVLGGIFTPVLAQAVATVGTAKASGASAVGADSVLNQQLAQISPLVATTLKGADDSLNKYGQVVKKIQNDLFSSIEAYENKQDDAQALLKLRSVLQNLVARSLETGIAFRAPLNDINLQLDQRGIEQQGEDADLVANARTLLRQKKVEINAFVAQLEESYIKANQLIEQNIAQSVDLFRKTLTEHVEFDSTLGDDVVSSGYQVLQSFSSIVTSWWRYVVDHKFYQFLTTIFISLIGAGGWLFLERRFMEQVKENFESEDGEVSYLRQLILAFFSILIPLFCFSLCCAVTLFLLHFFGLLVGEVGALVLPITGQLLLVFFIRCMAIALFSPKISRMRLIDVAPKSGRTLVELITLLAVVFGLNHALNSVYQVVHAPMLLSILKNLVTVLLVGALILAIAFIRPKHNKETGEALGWPIYVRIFLILLAIIPVTIALLGYVSLARYISQQIVVSGAFLVLLYLGFSTGRAITIEGAFANTSLGQKLGKSFNFESSTLDQFGLGVGFLINFLVVVVCIPPVFMQLGFSWDQIINGFVQLLTGFRIGTVSISLIAILTGIIFFLLCWFLSRWFIAWLDGSVLARGRVDSGVRNSISTVIGYLGVAVAALVGLSAAGFQLSSLALIAGGLSLGIGFGLQNIVQNFVSGLILLVERPFKVGDYIETGSINGLVKRISVRATEVETFQKQTIIVPNSSLINNNVGNWTHRNCMGRLDLPIKVPAIVDPHHVYDILIEIASQTTGVLKNPAPYATFSEFDASNFKFTLSVYLPDIVATTSTRNALSYEIYKRLLDEGISG